MKMSMWLRIAFLILCVLAGSVTSNAQGNEHVVILWDVTGSLLPQEEGQKDYDGSKLPTCHHGNGLFMDLKRAVIDCIEYAEEDPANKITVIPFNERILDVFTRNLSASGKRDLVKFVKDKKYVSHKYTNLVEPIQKFYNDYLSGNGVKYMFLFTDGDNNKPSTIREFIPTLESWTRRTKGREAYGFYVLVHPDADKPHIRRAVEAQSNFWIVPDAKVRIKTCTLPSAIKYNVRDEKGPKTINLKGKYSSAKGGVQLEARDPYYEVLCSDSSICNGKVGIEVKPKKGVALPENHTITLRPEIVGADSYTFVGPEEVKLNVCNLPERSLNLSVQDMDWGKASYCEPFLMSKESKTSVSVNIGVAFSEQAQKEHSSAVMKVFLVDKKGENVIAPSSQNLRILADGKELSEDGTVELTPDVTNVVLSIEGSSKTESSKYYGRIELVPSNLENSTINGTSEAFRWHFRFEHKMNPFMVSMIWLLGIVLACLLIWFICLRPVFYKKFGSLRKSLIIKGYSPLTIKFKGARQVVLSATKPQKTQSLLNRIFTGKIIYKVHPAFTKPIVLKPGVKRNILVMAKDYRVSPNPMPGFGEATIIRKADNVTISVR